MEYYSTLEGKEILQYATALVNLEDVMLSEKSQSQNNKYSMIPLILVLRVVKDQRQKVEVWFPRGGGVIREGGATV